jgi:hypothetical protein
VTGEKTFEPPSGESGVGMPVGQLICGFTVNVRVAEVSEMPHCCDRRAMTNQLPGPLVTGRVSVVWVVVATGAGAVAP